MIGRQKTTPKIHQLMTVARFGPISSRNYSLLLEFVGIDNWQDNNRQSNGLDSGVFHQLKNNGYRIKVHRPQKLTHLDNIASCVLSRNKEHPTKATNISL